MGWGGVDADGEKDRGSVVETLEFKTEDEGWGPGKDKSCCSPVINLYVPNFITQYYLKHNL